MARLLARAPHPPLPALPLLGLALLAALPAPFAPHPAVAQEAPDDPLPGPEGAPGPAGPSLPDTTTDAAFDDGVREPFAGFETWELENGLKVWYQRLPGAPNASMSVSVPYGADQDPEGLEELAHFTEHMLFSDHGGRTEQEIKDEIEGLGGQRNAFTYPDHTFYYVTIGREHGLTALAWLGRLFEPHAMEPEVVERNRQPVANEIRARPREIGDRIVAAFDPEWLRRPDFWEREFGLEVRQARRYDRWASLHRIGPEELRAFQERYYVPGAMTLTVVGDLERDSVEAMARRAFGDLEPRPVPDAYADPVDPGRYRRFVAFGFGPRPRYRTLFKLYEPSAEEHVRLLFVRELLSRRVGDRLRFGERKAAYGISVQVVQRGPAMYLSLQGTVDREDLEWARGVVEEELERLASGDVPAEEFEADRRAVVRGLISANQSAQDVNFQVLRHFWDRQIHRDFPDLAAVYRSLGPEEVAAFAREALARERRLEWIERPHPLGQAGVGAGLLLLVLATVRGVGAALTRPVDMGAIRYVARIRLSLPALVLVFAGTVLGGAVVVRLWAAVADWFVLPVVRPVDSYAVQMAAWGLVIAVGVALAVGWLSLLPRKILVFEDHVRIKHLAYRSRPLGPDDLQEVGLRTPREVWASGAALRTFPFTLGLTGPAVWIRPVRGPALYVRVRDAEGLLVAVEGALAPPETGPSS